MSYSDFTIGALKGKLEERNLPKAGIKLDLIRRLEEDDQVKSRRHNSPTNGQRTPDISKQHDQYPNLTEAQLEKVLRENFVPRHSDMNQRRENIRDEYTLALEQSTKKRDEAIETAGAKWEDDNDKAKKERDAKLGELDQKEKGNKEKRRRWGPALRKLKELRAGRGLLTHGGDFAPGASLGSTTSRVREQQEARRFEELSLAEKAPSPIPTKRKGGGRATAAQPPTKKRHRSQGDDSSIFDPSIYPQVQFCVESEPVSPQVKNTPHIFLPAVYTPVRAGSIRHLKRMIEAQNITPLYVRADESGYFVIFERSIPGRNQARLCLEGFQGRRFMGGPLRMVLFNG